MIIYTHNTTLSTKRYPKKTRFCLVQKIQECSFDIYESILRANEINVRTERDKNFRTAYQDKAITECKNMMNLIDISYQLGYININTCEHWARQALDVMRMTISWKKKEQ